MKQQLAASGALWGGARSSLTISMNCHCRVSRSEKTHSIQPACHSPGSVHCAGGREPGEGLGREVASPRLPSLHLPSAGP